MGRPSTPFGIRLRELRLASRLSQQKLADRIGITNVYVSKIENGHDIPSERVIVAMETALDVQDSELMVAAGIVPLLIRNRVLERLDAFEKLTRLSDGALDRIVRNSTNGR